MRKSCSRRNPENLIFLAKTTVILLYTHPRTVAHYGFFRGPGNSCFCEQYIYVFLCNLSSYCNKFSCFSRIVGRWACFVKDNKT